MRIVCTVTNDLSHDQRMIRICRTLTGAGHEVWLVGRNRPQAPPLPDQPFRQVRLPMRFSRGKLFYVEYNLRLLLFLLRHRADCINSVDLDTLLPGYLVSRLRRIPLVFDAHEYFSETPEVVRRPLVRKVWEGLARLILPRVRNAYTVGPALARLFGERYGTRFAVIRNLPVQKIPSEEKNLQEKKVILYQGMLNEGRGLECAIRAMVHLPELELWLAGKGDVEQLLRGLTAEYGLQDRVRFLGFVSPAALPALTARAWLGLNLLENRGLSYYYSLANKAFDYIQAGLPSIQMDFPEYSALQREYGCFVLLSQLDEKTLAFAIRDLVVRPEAYEQLAQNCRQAAAQLHWAPEAERLLAIYRRLK